MEEEAAERKKTEQREIDENFGDTVVGRVRGWLLDLLEYPETSKSAQALAFTSLSMVILSTVTFVIGSTIEKVFMIIFQGNNLLRE